MAGGDFLEYLEVTQHEFLEQFGQHCGMIEVLFKDAAAGIWDHKMGYPEEAYRPAKDVAHAMQRAGDMIDERLEAPFPNGKEHWMLLLEEFDSPECLSFAEAVYAYTADRRKRLAKSNANTLGKGASVTGGATPAQLGLLKKLGVMNFKGAKWEASKEIDRLLKEKKK